MADTIDNLTIEIKSEASKATTAIDNLASSLVNLDNAVSGLNLSKLSAFDTSKLRNASKDINSIKNAAKNLANVDVSKFTNNMQSLNTTIGGFNITSTAAEDMKGFASGVRSMVTASKNLNTKIDYDKLADDINRLVKAIKPLTDEMIRGGAAVSNYGTQMKELAQAAKIANKTTASSASKGGFFSSGKTFFKLANFSMIINALQKVSRVVASSINKINSYTEDMNLFTVAMGSYADRARNLAEEMEIKLGIDSGEAMKYMGVFQQLTTSFGVAGDQAIILSTNLTQLGYDLASFYNIQDTNEAFLKLQSGIAGEIEPLRRIGVDISAARLQQELYTLGINKNVDALSQADKALLRYIAIMKQTTNAQADMARTLENPANALRVLNAQINIASRWLGAIFIPALTKAISWVIAFVKVVGQVAKSVAEAFGFEMPEVNMPENNGLSDWATGLDDVGDSADKTGKKIRNLIGGFDELNILEAPTDSGGDGDITGNILGDLDLSGYDMVAGLAETDIDEKAEKIRQILEKILPLAVGIGTSFAAWKIATGLSAGLTSMQKKLTGISGAIGAIKAGYGKLVAIEGLDNLASKLGLASSSALLIVAAVALIAAQFVNLYTNSEAFRTGLERVGEIFNGIWTVVKDIGKGIFNFVSEIGTAIIGLLPEEWQEVIYAGLEKISGFVQKLDLNFGDLALTIAGIALLFVPGGQVAGIIILAFEEISVAIRALGLISDEQWEKIKTGASVAWDMIKTIIGDKVEALKTTFKGLFTVMEGLFTGDFGMLIEGAKLVFQGWLDFMPDAFKKPIGSY